MTSYTIIKHLNDLPDLGIIFSENIIHDLSLGDSEKIDNAKNKIENVDQQEWSRFRKYSNIYEFPRLSKYNIFKPISRAYYKIWEIIFDYNIDCDTETFHIAESPGGFIQAILEYKKRKYLSIKKCFTTSLSDCINTDIPNYHRFIVNNKNVEILVNKNCNGDVSDPKNIIYLYTKLKDSKIKFITADGGINDQGNYNNKEVTHIRLILCEVYLSLLILENGGTFVIKVFDIFTKATCDILYLLTYFFKEVIISKPLTSRSTNSEKYLVCKGYIKNNFSLKYKNTLFKCISDHTKNNNLYIRSLFKEIPEEFVKNIYLFNNDFTKNQILSIENTLDFMKNGTGIVDAFNRSDLRTYDFEIKKESLNRKWLEKYNLTNQYSKR